MLVRPPVMLGEAAAFRVALDLIQRTARCDAPALILGETGTGKELAARAIHYGSARRPAPFVPLNCGAVPETLFESELFGAERGAFTDARHSRSGLVAAAEGGTLFLDELDSLPLRAQVSLLRFLQDLVYRPVGGTRECQGNVRVIAAASPRLRELLKTGAFRDDLAFRLNVLEIEMPPLRDRPGDPRLLAEHYVARYVEQHSMTPRQLHPRSIEWMAAHSWPGNVRELDNLVRRALLLSDEALLRLCPAAVQAAPELPLRDDDDEAPCTRFNDARDRAMQSFERQYLEKLMRVAAGNVTHAARLAGKERRLLGRMLKKHGLGHGTVAH
ncbi:sigma-54 interacting regulator [Burkholderiales bacterium JOSHI_001]|nr:sigma-54 interacting regulator [Burkholderiales bacterium JOSHI_001]